MIAAYTRLALGDGGGGVSRFCDDALRAQVRAIALARVEARERGEPLEPMTAVIKRLLGDAAPLDRRATSHFHYHDVGKGGTNAPGRGRRESDRKT